MKGLIQKPKALTLIHHIHLAFAYLYKATVHFFPFFKDGIQQKTLNKRVIDKDLNTCQVGSGSDDNTQ